MLITQILEKNAKLYKNDISLVDISAIDNNKNDFLRKEITWYEFNKESNKFANLLLSNGIKKGDKVAILLMNCIEWLPIYFGILKTGAIAVPLNYRFTSEEIKYCLELACVDVLIYSEQFREKIENIYNRLDNIKYLFYLGDECPLYSKNYNLLMTKSSSRSPKIEINEMDDAAIYFSSGTTGFPKAILHVHKSLLQSCIIEQKHHLQTKNDTFLCIPPLYHTGAKMHWFGSLLVGGKAVLLNVINPHLILKTISQEKCSIVWLLVPWAQDILDSLENKDISLEDYDLSDWRLMHIGAQPVPLTLINNWKKLFPNQQYDTNYGLSESTGPGCVHLGIENFHKVGSIGKAGFGWETKIVDEELNDVKTGEIGELAVKGLGIMKCYLNDEKATSEVLKDGWLLTGDIAREDEDGFIYLVDRKKDIIISGGENIYPVQIENFLRKNDGISDVAVIGLPNSRLGEIVAAVIKVKEGIEMVETDIINFCKELPKYKRPKKIIFADVPRNSTGKIEKTKLRETYCGIVL